MSGSVMLWISASLRVLSSCGKFRHPGRSSSLLRKAIQFMKDNIEKPIGIDDIAAAATVSRRTLYGLFRAELATSPVEILTSFRMERARSLSWASEQSISNIVAQCGFGTHRSFNRLFFKSEKCTPRSGVKTLFEIPEKNSRRKIETKQPPGSSSPAKIQNVHSDALFVHRQQWGACNLLRR